MYSSRRPTNRSTYSAPATVSYGNTLFDSETVLLLLVLLVLIKEKADTKLILALVYVMI